MDLFKPEYKFYKRRVPPPDLSAVIDFSSTVDDNGSDVIRQDIIGTGIVDERIIDASLSGRFADVGLRPPETWHVSCLRQFSGLYFIRNPFLPEGQRSWIRRCLLEYPRRPNRTNLDDKLAKLVGADDCARWDDNALDNDDGLLSKLRWTTLGYHHDWDTKVYNLSRPRHEIRMPDEIQTLSELLISAIMTSDKDFKAQAAIVNFYDLNSSLGGHTDHSEIDHSSPLLSISFGQTAVFLLGGQSKETKPRAMYIKSGDVIIMSGESRLAYHAVPRILATDEKPWISMDDDDAADDGNPRTFDDPYWSRLSEYVDKFRININIRQVFPT